MRGSWGLKNPFADAPELRFEKLEAVVAPAGSECRSQDNRATGCSLYLVQLPLSVGRRGYLFNLIYR